MPESAALRIVFAGTPDFAVPPLEKLLSEDFRPIAVLTQPDRPAGRGRQLQASPVKQAAVAAGIPLHQPTTLKDPETQNLIASLQPDLFIVVAYGLILPPAVLELPVHGCWNIHASLLPRWRGAAPIQRAIEAGDTETGVCIMQMDRGLDTGAVLCRGAIRLNGTETGGSLHDELAQLGAGSLLTCVQALARHELAAAVPQPDTGISYAHKLVKPEAQLVWSEPAQVLERRVRAFNPWPVAWCDINGERTRIWLAAHEQRGHDQAPGTVLATDKSGIEIATGVQVLRLLELQRPGGRRLSAAEYLNAKTLPHRLVSSC
jgi:methionyl-tRNA formyltransferase